MAESKFYQMLRYKNQAHTNSKTKDSKNSFLNNPSAEQLTTREKILVLRLEALLEKYKNDNNTRERILQEFNMYCVNVTIAKELNDKNAIAKRTKEFHEYLSNF